MLIRQHTGGGSTSDFYCVCRLGPVEGLGISRKNMFIVAIKPESSPGRPPLPVLNKGRERESARDNSSPDDPLM